MDYHKHPWTHHPSSVTSNITLFVSSPLFFFGQSLIKQIPDMSFHSTTMQFKKAIFGTSLVAQWLRIHLPMQGTWVQALVQEDPTCRGATKPMRHNY